MKKRYGISIILCLLTYVELKPACEQSFLSTLFTRVHNEIIRTLHEPSFPAALATLAAGLTAYGAYYKMSHGYPRFAEYKKYKTIRDSSFTCMGPLLLLTALMVSDEEQHAGTFGSRTIALWTGIPITIGSFIYWLHKLL
jgi:hypothetical protein